MPKVPGSGRKKGSLNKNRLPLKEKAAQLGVDPFEVLLLFAKRDWEGLGYPDEYREVVTKTGIVIDIPNITSDQQLKAACEACQYIHPKLRSVEMTENKDPNKNRPLAHLTDEELDKL